MPALDSTFQPTVLFDGDCGLCNGFVRFIAVRDGGRYRFVSLQSALGRDLLGQAGIADDGRTMVLLDERGAWTRSTAVLRACGELAGPWQMASGLLLVPRPVRDGVYRLVASVRRRIPARACALPPPGLVARTVLD